MPDVPVTYRMEDYLSAKDLGLDWVLKDMEINIKGDRLKGGLLWETDAVQADLNVMFGTGMYWIGLKLYLKK